MAIHVMKGGRAGVPSELRTATFTGTVWGDPVLAETDGVTINSVSFAPGARTHWHSHDGGQVLVVTSGSGRIYDRDGNGSPISAGDVVFIEPGVEHWHGARPRQLHGAPRDLDLRATTGSSRSRTPITSPPAS